MLLPFLFMGLLYPPITLRDKGHNLLYCCINKSSLPLPVTPPLYNNLIILHKSSVQYLLHFPAKTNTCTFTVSFPLMLI